MQNAINNINGCLRQAHDRQGQPLYDEREIRSITDLLLDEICGISRVERIMHPETILPTDQRLHLEAIARNLQQGIPVQQAMGYAWFCGEKFRVTADTLIPRPETAELVQWIVEDTQQAIPRICDIGTGTGCIAISLARLIHGSEVLAVDKSEAALSIARSNACQQHVDNIQFAQIDILEASSHQRYDTITNWLSTIYQPGVDNPQSLDIVVSNPPYICQCEASEMSDIVLQHEPALALFVPDNDPLQFYRSIAQWAWQILKAGGLLYFEINAAYGPQTCALLSELGYQHVQLRKDINGRDRMIRATHP